MFNRLFKKSMRKLNVREPVETRTGDYITRSVCTYLVIPASNIDSRIELKNWTVSALGLVLTT